MLVAPHTTDPAPSTVDAIAADAIHSALDTARDPVAPARGAFLGIALGACAWAAVGGLVWLLQRAL